MLPSRKIYMGITGAALIALGILCASHPLAAILSIAWIIGLITLISGIATLFNWINIRRYFPQSGTILLSAIMQIILGIIFLKNDELLAVVLPFVFAVYLLFEGINQAVRSFDYRKVHFKGWWLNFILGILTAILGCMSLFAPGLGGLALTIFLSVGFVVSGIVYIIALFAVNRFENKINENSPIDEQ